ncbi:MAG: lipopolysaccharide kinase InaA family protein, partial [Pseudomonadales bacterium]
LGPSPSIHTVNLFVERVMQPEVSDHRAVGRWATNLARLNLVKKARILNSISKQQGIGQTVCSYNCWTRKRLARENVAPLVKQVDYLVRYLLLAAASGALDRVYWGPLICNRDGLIDCGDANYPEIDNVSFHARARGCVDDYQKLPAYTALQSMCRLLRGAKRVRAVSAENGLTHVAVVDADDTESHVVWCVDGCIAPLSRLYPTTSLEEAMFQSPLGEVLESSILNVTEHPLLIRWLDPAKMHQPSATQINGLADVRAERIVHGASSRLQSVLVDTPDWRGVVALADGAEVQTELARFLPEALLELQEEKVLRDKRNRLWNVRIHDGLPGLQTVKLNRARGIKRFTYRFTDSKGRRHWNNATEMLRRGINTPQPLAFFERPRNSGIRDNYYVCEFVADAFSCREVFSALSSGEDAYLGIERQQWLAQIAGFVASMHHRGVVHNDLSSGNIIMTLSDDGDLQFYLIDIGRAVVNRRKAYTSRGRFADLNRICYKLSWADRESFVQAYNGSIRGRLPRWWRLPLWSYDAKQNSKKLLKGNYRRKSASGRRGAGRSA